MSETFKPPVRFPRLRLQVNAFFLFALLLIAGFIALVGYKQGWLIKHTTIHFVTMDALGINKGMPVKFYGLTVGSVKDLVIADQGVEVQLTINDEYMPRILEGSRARFTREAGVIGAGVIEIIPVERGRAGLAPLGENSRIEFERSRGIAEIIEDLRKQAAPALNEMRQTFSQIKRLGVDAEASLSVVRQETQRLPETHTALRKLIGDASRTAEQASATLDSARRAADSLERETPVIAGKLSTALDSINAAAGQVRETARQGEGAVRGVGPFLDQGETLAREGREVIDAAKRTWPLSGAFGEPRDPTLPVDSFEARSAPPPR
jgi:ABC-type transporter Mla subunit MlaD